MKKLISIVIVTYNSQKYIENCLNTLFQFNDIGKCLEVIIVDNSSQEISNKMFDFIRTNYKQDIKLIHNYKNGGYGQGNNLGITHASGDIIGIMNPDIVHTQSLFLDVLEKFKNNSNLGMLGYKQLGGKNISFYFRPEHQKPLLSPMLMKLYNKINCFKVQTMHLSGAYFFTPKSIFEKIGQFDEEFFLYCEESDVTLRLMNKNYEIQWEPKKSYLHDIDDRVGNSAKSLDCLMQSIQYYCKKFSFDFNSVLNAYTKDLMIKGKIYSLMGKNTILLNEQKEILKQFKN